MWKNYGWFHENRVSSLKLKVYVTMCVFMIGVLDFGHLTHDVFLVTYLLTLIV